MAVATHNPSGLKIRFDLGKDEVTNKSIVKTKTYSNVKHDALDDDVYFVGSAIASLCEHNVLEIAKIDNTTLSN